MRSLRHELFRLRLGAPLLVTVLVTGCAVGPRMVQASRGAYNEVVHRTAQEELLLNLVRLRYHEAPEFLEVASIATQFELTGTVGLGGEVGRSAGESNSLGTASAGIGFSERPTITFAPRRDAEFLRHLLEPVDLEDPVLLVDYGWGLGRVLRVTVERLGRQSDPTDRERSSDPVKEFEQAIDRMDDLHRRGLMTLAFVPRLSEVPFSLAGGGLSPSELLDAEREGLTMVTGEGDARPRLMRRTLRLVVNFDPSAFDDPVYVELAALTGLPARALNVDVDPGSANPSTDRPDVLEIATRSVLESMAYLSAGVDVPDDHVEMHWVSGPTERTGLRVRVSSDRPSARLAVSYRNHWFYVDDADLESRRTLGVLNSLIRLRVGAGGGQSIPLLTLPVGR